MALIFVTGARGAIGQHVVRVARARGHSVAGLGHGSWRGDDDLPAIDHWMNGRIDGDNLLELRSRAGAPDAIVHLAGGALVGTSIIQPSEDFHRTVESMQNLLEWQRTHAPEAKLVVASSAAVYGGGHAGPIAESAALTPTSPYGAHKAMVELAARSYAQQFGIHVAIVRLFSVYGPGLRKQLIWDMTARLAGGETQLVLSGTGEETRDFLHITDAATMLVDALELADISAPAFNGCTGRSTSIADMANLVASFFPNVDIAFSGQSRVGDPPSLVGDPRLSREAGLSALKDIREGIAGTIAWSRNAAISSSAAS